MDFIENYKSLPSKTKGLMNFGLILALVIALPLFIWAITNLNFNQKERAASGEPIDISLGEPVRGLPSAKVTIVAYMDFQCPHCKSFIDNTFSKILAKYPNDVKFIFKDFPIITAYPLAEKASLAGQCAFGQGMFWEMHDLIFAKQTTLTESDFVDFSDQLSLDTALFNICYNNESTLPEVFDDMSEGFFKGVEGTPTFFVGSSSSMINATKITGDQPFSVFEASIEKLLNSQVSATATPTSLSTSLPTATATSASGTGGYVEGEPNSCGGTCGSNYNCKSNLYCYQGLCRNPICSTESDCDCSTTHATATAVSIISTVKTGTDTNLDKATTPKSTLNGSPKSTPVYTGGMTLIDKPSDLTRNETETQTENTTPVNMFLTKYAMIIVGILLVFAIVTIIFVIKQKRNSNIPHISPPINI